MKKRFLIIGLIGIIFSSALPLAVSAASCGYYCDDTADTLAAVCAKSGATVGSTITINGPADCPGTQNCGMGARAVCCCQPVDSIVKPSSAAKSPVKTAPITPKLEASGDIIKLTALTEEDCTLNPDGTYYCKVPWLSQYIVAIYNYGLSIAGILAAIVLMAGGVLWLVSGGDASKVTQAKELITGSIIGLVILASSYIILTQINPDLVKFKSISIGSIKYQDFEPADDTGNPDNSTACNDCAYLDYLIPVKNGRQINSALAGKLLTAWNASGGGWIVTEAYPPSSEHQSTCHYNGMCADVALTSDKSCEAVKKLITDLENSGLTVLNEYTGCGGTATTYSTGGHLHVR